MKHSQYECPPGCDKPHCNFCEGGLFSCTICNGAEGSLPTECPGRKMAYEEERAVYAGHLDFKDGKWVTHVASAGHKNIEAARASADEAMVIAKGCDRQVRALWLERDTSRDSAARWKAAAKRLRKQRNILRFVDDLRCKQIAAYKELAKAARAPLYDSNSCRPPGYADLRTWSASVIEAADAIKALDAPPADDGKRGE